MKPHKESLAYAEKMRKTKRRRKEVGELESGKITFSGLGEYIRGTSEFQRMQGVMGIGAGVAVWENSYSAQGAAYTQAITNGVSSENYEALKEEAEKVRAELAQAKSALKESHEIIEALAADMEDIGNLKEENARLRIVGCLKVKAAEVESYDDIWYAHMLPNTELDIGAGCPDNVVGQRVFYELRSGESAGPVPAEYLSWGLLPGAGDQEIIKYRIA